MRKIIVLMGLLIVSTVSYAQTQYTVNKVAHGTVSSTNVLKFDSFSQLAKRFKADLYKDALVFDESYDGHRGTYYKFVREINTDDPNKHMWNALDANNSACQITIKDYNTYTLIAVKYFNSSAVTIYQTL